MTDFKVKIHQIRFRLRLWSRPRWAELTALPETPYLDLGPLRGRGGAGLGKRRVRGGRGKWRGGKGRAPKLLLNQGPSEPCYATVSIHSENTNVTIPSGPPPVTGSITDPVESYYLRAVGRQVLFHLWSICKNMVARMSYYVGICLGPKNSS